PPAASGAGGRLPPEAGSFAGELAGRPGFGPSPRGYGPGRRGGVEAGGLAAGLGPTGKGGVTYDRGTGVKTIQRLGGPLPAANPQIPAGGGYVRGAPGPAAGAHPGHGVFPFKEADGRRGGLLPPGAVLH